MCTQTTAPSRSSQMKCSICSSFSRIPCVHTDVPTHLASWLKRLDWTCCASSTCRLWQQLLTVWTRRAMANATCWSAAWRVTLSWPSRMVTLREREQRATPIRVARKSTTAAWISACCISRGILPETIEIFPVSDCSTKASSVLCVSWRRRPWRSFPCSVIWITVSPCERRTSRKPFRTFRIGWPRKQLAEHGEFLSERTELAEMLTLITKTEDRGEEGEEGVEEEENEKAEEEEEGRQEDGEEENEDSEPTDRLQEAKYLDVVEVATHWVTVKRKTKQRRSQGWHEEESVAKGLKWSRDTVTEWSTSSSRWIVPRHSRSMQHRATRWVTWWDGFRTTCVAASATCMLHSKEKWVEEVTSWGSCGISDGSAV